MKKIYFKGYYGFKNLGDDIFCVAADWICQNIWRNSEAIFIGSDLPKLSHNAKIYSIKNKMLKRVFELVNLFMVDKIIYFGGSLLHSSIKGIFDIKYYLNKYEILNNKLGTIGTSIGPFKTQQDMDSMKNFLNKFQFISVRDYSSLEIIQNMNISPPSSFCFDPAILITDIYPSLKVKKTSNDDDISLGISLCHYERYVNGDLTKEKIREDSIELLMDELLDSNDKISEVVLFIFHGGADIGDKEITNQFYERYKDNIKISIVEYDEETEVICTKIANCDLIFGTRLHSGILAYSLGLPFILVEYHEKCTEFLNTIKYNNRFDINNNNQNIKLLNNMIDCIINKDEIEGMKGMINPEYFKTIIKNQLECINI